MAGSKKDDVYNVPHSNCLFPQNVMFHDIVKCFIPGIDEWRDQQYSAAGDNDEDKKTRRQAEAARNLPLYLLPLLCERVFKTGIYFIEAYPEHPITLFIKARLREGFGGEDWYTGWAASERARINQVCLTNEHEQVQKYHPDTKVAFNECKEKIGQLNEVVSELVSMLKCGTHIPAQSPATAQSPAQSPAQTAAQSPPPVQGTWPLHQEVQWSPHDQAAARAIAASTSRHTVPIADAADTAITPTLNNDPFTNITLSLPEPSFPNKMPRNFTILLREHRDCGLGRYKGQIGRRSHWGKGIATALSRRMTLFSHIEEYAKVLATTRGTRPPQRPDGGVADEKDWQDLAAIALDKKYLGTLNQTLTIIRAASGKKRKRKDASDAQPL
jgi:hypothetical protein